MEKIIKPMSGFLTLVLTLVLFVVSIVLFINSQANPWIITLGVILTLTGFYLSAGLIVVSPNHSRVLTFFGKYIGTAKVNGLLFVNPLYTKQKISLRAENLESSRLKVNDSMGNPIEIAAVIVWRVSDTYKAAFEVEDYEQYVKED